MRAERHRRPLRRRRVRRAASKAPTSSRVALAERLLERLSAAGDGRRPRARVRREHRHRRRTGRRGEPRGADPPRRHRDVRSQEGGSRALRAVPRRHGSGLRRDARARVRASPRPPARRVQRSTTSPRSRSSAAPSSASRRCCAGTRRHAASVSPAEFIPAAEATGMIMQLGELALREACGQTARWERDGLLPERFITWVNLSGMQLSAGGIDGSCARRWPRRAAAARLGLEVTETAIVQGGAAGERARERAAGAAPRRRQHRDRRLRHGLLLARPAAALPDRHDQGRPLVHPGRRARPSRCGDHRERRQPRARTRPRRDGGGHRVRGAAGFVARAGMRPRAGLPVRAGVPPAELAELLGGAAWGCGTQPDRRSAPAYLPAFPVAPCSSFVGSISELVPAGRTAMRSNGLSFWIAMYCSTLAESEALSLRLASA